MCVLWFAWVCQVEHGISHTHVCTTIFVRTFIDFLSQLNTYTKCKCIRRTRTSLDCMRKKCQNKSSSTIVFRNHSSFRHSCINMWINNLTNQWIRSYFFINSLIFDDNDLAWSLKTFHCCVLSCLRRIKSGIKHEKTPHTSAHKHTRPWILFNPASRSVSSETVTEFTVLMLHL